MKLGLIRLVLGVALLSTGLALGCGDDGGGGGGGGGGGATFAGSCEMNDGSICIEYTGAIWTEEAVAGCDDGSNLVTYSADPCPNGALGRCDYSVAGQDDSEVVTFYYDDATIAENACSAMGGEYTAL